MFGVCFPVLAGLKLGILHIAEFSGRAGLG